MRVVYPSPEQNDKLAILIANRLEANDFQPCQCLAMMDGDKLAGVVVYFCYRHPSIEIAIFADDPRWVTNRDMVGEILAYPFVQLGCKRVTAMVDRHNKRSRKMVKGLGFVEEGKLRKAADKGDVFIYGLLPNEYRLRNHGQKIDTQSARSA